MSESVHAAGKDKHSDRHFLQCDLTAILFLFFLTLGLFFRTVFQGKPISKLSRLANWDSAFQQYSNGSVGSCDPSLVQLMLPNYFCVAQSWHDFVAPLWNPYSGCGMPMVGDISAAVFAPLHIALALFPSARTYNLILVGEVFLCIVGTYLLARLLNLGRLSAIFAAISYAFCPYILYYLELLSGTSQALFPLLFASFVWTARTAGIWPLIVATFATAVFVLSGHPESSLYGVLCAVVLYFAVGISALGKRSKSVLGLLPGLLFIGSCSLALSAPMILPFLEYLTCGDSYKYGDSQAAFAPWQGIILNIFQPCYGMASPFLGVIAVTLIPFCLAVSKRQKVVSIMLIALAVICLLLIARFGWLDQILTVRPLSYLITVYLIPCFLLFMAVLAGIGVEAVSRRKDIVRFLWPAAAFPIVISLVLCLFRLNLKSFNFDETLPDMTYKASDIVFSVILATSFLAAVWLALRNPLKRIFNFSVFFSMLAILVNSISLLSVARYSLPVQPSFDFPKTELTDYLLANPGRALSITEHVLKPNSNIVYKISSMRVHNPMQPARFAEFTKLCGARLDEFRNQTYEMVTDHVDLASVRYIISQFKPLPQRYKLVTTTSQGISVYENPNRLPETYLVSRWRQATDRDDAIGQIQASDFDPRYEVVLEGTLPANGQRSAMTPLVAKRVNCNQIDIAVASSNDSILVLTDIYYPGWQATIDGKETEILRANFLFRAIAVPAGNHAVTFTYRPQSFRVGLFLASAATFLMLLLAVRSCLMKDRLKH
ncbi:hypothetical protein BH11CYA1_BH11CYA1_48620 [soil metagenome]